MKIYRTESRGEFGFYGNGVKNDALALKNAIGNDAHFVINGEKATLVIRRELLRETEFTAKQIAKMMPTWAKYKPIRSIGDKVTAFYAVNDKVITRMHECGFPVGSDEFQDWAETQPDPFRASRLYLESKYGAHA